MIHPQLPETVVNNALFKNFSKLKINTRYATDRQFIIFTKITKLNFSLEVSQIEICNQVPRRNADPGLNTQGYCNSTTSPPTILLY